MSRRLWGWTRHGAAGLVRLFSAPVMLTGAGIALLAFSELADRLEHGLSAVMTFIVVDGVLWSLALGWVAAQRLRRSGADAALSTWLRDSALIGWLRDWILPTLAMVFAALILLFVVADHLTVGAGPDAWLAMGGAALLLIAQIIGQASPHNNGR
jgi:hypothetical protein